MNRPSRAPLAAIALLLAGAAAAAPDDRSHWATLAVDEADSAPMPPPAAPVDAIDRKLHAQLRTLLDPSPAAADAAASFPDALRAGDHVLVEIRFDADAPSDAKRDALARSAGELRHELGPDRVEAWLPVSRLQELASDPGVVRIAPARRVRHMIGSKTTEGLARGRVNLWHSTSPVLTGNGITIAVIDGFDNSSNRIGALQTSNDWPPSSRIVKLDYKHFPAGSTPASCSAPSFGCAAIRHGNATLEIVYDIAPAADYRAYDTVTIGDWRAAILDAANVNSSGGSLGLVRANVISASLGAPLDGVGDGTAQAGSIAEAAGFARNRGVLVVNAAGNEREQHWDGLFTLATSGNGFHTWTGSNTTFNHFGEGSDAFCIPAGTDISVDTYWNNWAMSGGNYVASHDYDLYLYRRTNATTWESLPVAQSNFPQSGGTGHTPQEQLQYVASGSTVGCPANSAVFGIAITRVLSTTNRDNLEVFANIPLRYRVNARSLGFPADSPNVLTVGAIDVANMTTTPLESFSSEGPVLAADGGLPSSSPGSDPNLKPDLVGFDNVSTVSYLAAPFNSNFFGTSAATPHVAGVAALLMQRYGIQSTAANLTTKIVTPLRDLSLTGTNDHGTTGKDYQYGNGRLRFQTESGLSFLQQPGNTGVGATITPAVRVRVLDDEGLLSPYGLLGSIGLAIGNDPNGGSAVLANGGAQTVLAGIATWNTLNINLGGSGYTLQATATGLPALTSSTFNITTGAATKLAFEVQPSTVVAGSTIAPAITVRVEDSAGNLVTTDNATQVRLTRTAGCTTVTVTGGGPVTAVNGIATFPSVVLYTPGSGARLQASATGRTSDTSDSFNVTTNANQIFRSNFDAACLP